MNAKLHQPVLLDEVIEFLRIKRDGRYVDGTLGLGGHAEAILKKLGPQGRLLGLDIDAENLRRAKDRLQLLEDQTLTRQVNFRGLQGVLRELGWWDVAGMIFDLGVSSVHLDDPSRGFSFQSEGPLDMRLDQYTGQSVLFRLRCASEEELINLFNQFGEFNHVRKFVRHLLMDVANGRITTTAELSSLCARTLHRRGRSHPATRIFLALRSWVNDELGSLEVLLNTAPTFLGIGGRLAVITFHSLEDRLVKNKFRFWSKVEEETRRFQIVTKKPVCPTQQEIETNPRSRSAHLRVLERIQ